MTIINSFKNWWNQFQNQPIHRVEVKPIQIALKIGLVNRFGTEPTVLDTELLI